MSYAVLNFSVCVVFVVPAHPGFPGQIPQSRKTVVCVCVCCVCGWLVGWGFMALSAQKGHIMPEKGIYNLL